jgi:hypothetical protein
MVSENAQVIELEILFHEKSVKFKSILDPIKRRFTYSFLKIGESSAETLPFQDTSKDSLNFRAAFVKVLELAIPFESLDCGKDERLEFFVTIRIAESFGERWPIYGTFSAELPGKDFLGRMWHA